MGSIIARLRWQHAYARLCLKSGYDFNWLSAWDEAAASWDYWTSECPQGEKIIPPAEAVREDCFEWSTR